MKILTIRVFSIIILLLLWAGFTAQKANAANAFASLSDMISTSRPSPSAPLWQDQAVGDTQLKIVDIPGASTAEFSASDSAIVTADTGQVASSANVSSQSAQQTGPPTFRWVYLTSTLTTNVFHHKGTAVIFPVTATHTIKFQTNSSIPSGGQIIITFPAGGANNSASPSATAFSFNNELAAAITDVICYPTNACSGGKASNQSNTFTFTTGGIIAGGTVVYINIGCGAAASGPCTQSAPRLINPTKGSTTQGVADAWKVTVASTDTPGNGGTILDYGSIKISTVEEVQVQALVEPTITFSIIGGIGQATNLNTLVTSGCTSATQDTGIVDSATFVDLGLVNTGNVNVAFQQLQVSTNGFNGYVITATSSGRFADAANGHWIADANQAASTGLSGNDAPVPVAISAGTEGFGIHACGPATAAVNSDEWLNAGTITLGGGTAKYMNPWNSGTNQFYATLATHPIGPVSPAENTAVVYGVSIAGTTVPGLYTNDFEYVATATF
jgi:hypothetical protein